MVSSAPDFIPGVFLCEMRVADLPVFFEQQVDPEANRMAACTPKDPADREAFFAHWAKILADPAIVIRTILFDGQAASNILPSLNEVRLGYFRRRSRLK